MPTHHRRLSTTTDIPLSTESHDAGYAIRYRRFPRCALRIAHKHAGNPDISGEGPDPKPLTGQGALSEQAQGMLPPFDFFMSNCLTRQISRTRLRNPQNQHHQIHQDCRGTISQVQFLPRAMAPFQICLQEIGRGSPKPASGPARRNWLATRSNCYSSFLHKAKNGSQYW